MKFIGLWILNPLKTSGGQPVALGGFGVWLGGYFFARLIIFVFVNFLVFYERFVVREIYTMIPLIIFVLNFAFSTGDVWTLWQNRHDSIDCFFCGEFGSPGRCHPKTACEKSARKKLQVRRRHPNTAGEKFAGEKV